MKMINDFILDKTCYGCGVCVSICPKKVLDLQVNADGFYTPIQINPEACNKCGLCTKVCSYIDQKEASFSYPISSFGGWSNDKEVRRKCSSGGVAFEIGKYLLASGYKVCSVRYNNEKNRAEHFIASTIEELISSTGSKYIQSYTIDGFRSIKRNEKYLIIGSPCQIDSFRRYISLYHSEDNFIFVDFFCHGVPSKFIWDKYIKDAENKVGKITYASWRNKFNGWHDSWAVGINGDKLSAQISSQSTYTQLIQETKTHIDSRFTKGDVFYRMFLEHHCMSAACHNVCKFKRYHSSADIRLGDFWGKTYLENEDGVSSVLCFTDKGEEIVKKISVTLVSHDPEIVCEGQLLTNAKESIIRPWFMRLLRNDNSKLCDIKKVLYIYTVLQLPNKIINKIKAFLR